MNMGKVDVCSDIKCQNGVLIKKNWKDVRTLCVNTNMNETYLSQFTLTNILLTLFQVAIFTLSGLLIGWLVGGSFRPISQRDL